jgi:hypothetical protein
MESPESLPEEKRRAFLPPHVEILRLDFSRLGRPARSQPIGDRPVESGRVVKHLLAIVREHRASSRRIGSPLDERALRAVFYALRVESLGGDPRALLQHPEPVAAWLRQALFEDLLEVLGAVFFTTRLDENSIRYKALKVAFWQECLAIFEDEILRIR